MFKNILALMTESGGTPAKQANSPYFWKIEECDQRYGCDLTQGVRYDRIGLPTWGEIQQQQTHTRTSLTLISHLLVAGQGQDEGKARDERSSCTGCHVPPRCSCMCPESYLLQEEYCLCPFSPSPPLRPVATHVIIMCGWVYSEVFLRVYGFYLIVHAN